MKKVLPWLWLVAAVIFLAACGSTADVETGLNPVEESTAEPPAVIEAESPTLAAVTTDFKPAASLAEASVERGQDYAHGAEDPLLTIVEYGDFQ